MSKFDAYEHLNMVLNPDGSVTHLVKFPTIEATEDAKGIPILSKDVTLDADKKTWLRIFRPSELPSNDNSIARLPIIIYFHGGGWIQFSAADVVVHEKCTQFTREISAIVVSVEYGISPESRLPMQYENAVDAILWVKKQALDPKGEQWLRDYGDFSRCYLYGCSNGGNIVFNATLRALDLELEPLKIAGLVLNQPMFSGNKRTKSELSNATDPLLPLPALDLMWQLALPLGADRDHRYCNPMVEGPHKKKIRSFGRCLMIGFGGDPMIDRQQEFVTMLVKCGVKVEARFDDVGFHGIDLVDAQRASVVLNIIKDFIS